MIQGLKRPRKSVPLKKLAYTAGAVMVIMSVLLQVMMLQPKIHAQTLSVGPNNPGACAEDTADSGTLAWTGYTNATTSNDTRATRSTSSGSARTHYVECSSFGFSIPSSAIIIGVELINERSATVDGGIFGDAFVDGNVKLSKAGTMSGSSQGSGTDTWETTDTLKTYGSPTSLWGTTLTPSDINNSGFGAGVQALSTASTNASVTARIDTMTITVYFYGASQITQAGYIWENDDEDQAAGDVYDNNSQQAAGNTAITNVRKGERLTLRMQLKNTGGADLNQGLGLFYDKNDGNFRQAGFPAPIPAAGSSCAASNWSCTAVESTGTVGTNSKIAMTPDGNPYAMFTNTSATPTLYSAEYVGSGGTGCDVATWSSCADAIITSTDAGAVAVGPDGTRYGLYYTSAGSSSTANLAEYVGAGNGSGCTSTAWDCNGIGATTNGTPVAMLGVVGDGTVYAVATNGIGAGAQQVLCTRPSGGGFSCSAFTDLAMPSFGSNNIDGTKAISYYGTGSNLVYAEYVGSGGSCSNTAWACTTVDGTGTVGQYSSLSYATDGTAYISYYDGTNFNLKVAYFVGSGGNCDTMGGSDAWQCTTVDGTGTTGQYTSIAFAPDNTPYVSYYDAAGNNNLRLAYFVGSGGNCDTTGGSDAWQCTTIESTNDVGQYSSLSFGNDGVPYISYYDVTNSAMRVASLPPGAGELSIARPQGGTGGDSINESHADMTTTTDTSNRDDADRIGGGTWSNGVLIDVLEPTYLNLPADDCTEISFVIDTSQAVAGTTYRFIVATADAFQNNKGKWRGAAAISQYPTLTIAPDTDFKASKSIEPQGTAACNGSVWTCTLVEGTASVGEYSSMAMSPSGVPYISFYDTTGDDLRFAKYVGSGGNCDASGGSDAWTCTTIDDTVTNIGQYTSMAFAQDGTAYISYYDVTNANLRIAKYVGSGGTGCKAGVTDWACTVIESTDAAGEYSSIAISPSGVPYISYYNNTDDDLRVAYYDGDGIASNCAGGSNAWTCVAVDSSVALVGLHTSIAFSPDGVPYISYYDDTNDNLRIAQYVSTGGTGCTATTAYTCTLVEATTTGTNEVGQYTSIAFSSSGTPYISYYDLGSGDLRVANYDGDGSASGCTGGSVAWTCTAIDDTSTAVGLYTSIAFSPTGQAYVSYYDSTNGDLRLAQNVGSSGTGCKSGVTAWTCTTISASTDGPYSSLAFSNSGVPYISFHDTGGGDIGLAKLELYHTKPSFSSNFTYPGRSGLWANGLFSLSDGRSPRTNGTGVCTNGIANYLGICGLFDDGGHMESVTATAYQRPQFNFSQRFDSNTILPTAAWRGRSDVAPNTASTAGDIKLQVYRFGSTNAWTDVATDNSSTNCNTDNCDLMGIPGGTISDYFESDGAGHYWTYWRVWQYENASGSETLRTDLFQLQFINKQMRHGKLFENNTKRVFTF